VVFLDLHFVQHEKGHFDGGNISNISYVLFQMEKELYRTILGEEGYEMRKIFLPLLVVFLSNPLAAQEKDTTYKYWITVGAWIGRNLSENLSYNFSLGDNFYKVGYFIRGGFSETPSVGEDGYLFNTVDISVGKRLQSKWFQSSMFVGPSFVFGKKRASFGNTDDYETAGLEADIQLLFRPANEVGIGVGLYGNLNFVKNYIGLNVNLTLGNGK
jgi:hypothetical protein